MDVINVTAHHTSALAASHQEFPYNFLARVEMSRFGFASRAMSSARVGVHRSIAALRPSVRSAAGAPRMHRARSLLTDAR
ncbi:hypothetical protein [Burkholderia mayonis]|uniref:Uncharacterized protein n=1 Tax=Burkholderia mayonis TaxID=1385591 RepID=A0A1B4G6D6_9BURK|nr:hypothetical protein [Burkholderia mayonis]AOJ11474.1 hypothetical protein WS71_30945 [Burkholderia mayonis]KVE46449.1 hypothetical protein WS71_22110 [Burkholderia mayonis]